jgi:hypothetical protein
MDLQTARSFIAICVAACALGLSALACGGDSATEGGDPPGPGGGFESDNPSNGAAAAPGSPGTGTGGAGGAGGMGGNGGGAGSGGPPTTDDPNRAIEEADIIQVDADKLYALSRYGGLSVIDVARPEQLRMLGRFRTEATPFEMYVKNNVVLGLFTEWGKYVTTADGWQWVQTSQVVALDASDPANIRSLGEFSVAGAISDSRIVGNILYVVSYQNGSCWECAATQPRTVVLSLDISNPSAVKKVDELVYNDVNDEWGWGARSITVTDQRMYVGGREWRDGVGGSTIQVIDISNPNGDLVPGASVQAEGQITSRWQMDEYQGTLRVLSQPWQGTANPPVLQTYRVESAQSVVPLARMPLVLRRPEQLQSTRFDGTRAYAITFERTDPLFTIDLTNPAAPRQMGELEMPGWVYHMEPRGDRLYGLGFDQNNAEGALNVSIFDVSNLSTPKLIDRVNFGANWGYLPEDQDRIHKAFRLLDAQGLILVPYAGYSYDTTQNYCSGSYKSGVQLIDFTRDDLVLRGSAPSFGEARRAFLHRDRLFTVSDDRVQSFDIANRDAPAKLHQLSLARQVTAAAVAGDHLVRLGNDWWSHKAQIDVTPLNGADAPNGLGGLDLESILGSSCGSGFYGARVLGNGNRAYVVYDQYVYEGTGTQKTAVAVIDVSNPAAPRIESHQSIGVAASYAWGGWGYDSVIASGERLIQLGSTLVFAHGEASWANGSYVTTKASLVVVDLADPAKPRTTTLELPNAQGLTGLHVDGSTILTSHFEPVAGNPGRVRFYMDRIDVSNPAAPRFIGKVNVPGSLFAWEPVTGRAITVDYRRSVEKDVSMEDCYKKGGYARASWVANDGVRYDLNSKGTCYVTHHSLRQVRVDSTSAAAEGSWDVPGDLQLGRADVGARRVYVGLNRSYYGPFIDGCYTGGCGPIRGAELLVLSGFELGALTTATLPLTAEPWGGYIYHLLAFGDRALVAADSGSELVVVDASTPTQLKTVRTIDAHGYVSSLQKHGDLAIVASGYDGAQVVDVRD